jgi:ParB/RepB/Spo0J family partition protein
MRESLIISLDRILTNIDRSEGGLGDIEQLAMSIDDVGLINPITLRSMPDGTYQVIAGRRRIEAVKSLDWEGIPAVVVDHDDAVDDTAVQLAENTNRLDMHPLDEAVLFKKRVDAGDTIEDLGKYYMRSKSAIYQRILLNDLVDEAKARYRSGLLNITSASMIAAFDSEIQGRILKDLAFSFERKQVPGRYEVENAITRSAGTKIGEFFKSLKCETCQMRTKHSDASLFPEINLSADFCLDHTCFQESYQETMRDIVSRVYAEQDIPISSIKKVPYLLETGYPPFPLAGKNLELDGRLFPVVSWRDIVELERDELEEYEDIRRSGIVIGIKSKGEIIDFAMAKEYYDRRKSENDEDDDEEPIVPCKSQKERDAYDDVTSTDWALRRTISERMANELTGQLADKWPDSEGLYIMLTGSFNLQSLRFVFKSLDPTLDDDMIESGWKWLERFTVDQITQAFFKCSLHENLIRWISDPLDDYDQTEKFWRLVQSFGTDSEEIHSRHVEAYKTEIRTRMDAILQDEIQEQEESPEETEDGAESVETFPEDTDTD